MTKATVSLPSLPAVNPNTAAALNALIKILSGQTIADLDLAGSLAIQETPLVISGGVIDLSTGAGDRTVHFSSVSVDTEAAAATDYLDTINGGRDGQILFIRAFNDTRTPIVRSVGNIVVPDVVNLDTYSQFLFLRYVSLISKWIALTPLSHGADKHTDRIREIPYDLTADARLYGSPSLPDEVATNFIVITFPTPGAWVAGTDINIKTLWLGQSGTGLVDLEHTVGYGAYDVNDGALTTLVAAWTNTPTQPSFAGAVKYDTVTITIAAANIAAAQGFYIAFRRNTGDANTGAVRLMGVKVLATLDE